MDDRDSFGDAVNFACTAMFYVTLAMIVLVPIFTAYSLLFGD